MIHRQLLECFKGSINKEMYDLSTKYLLEATNSSKYISKLRDWLTLHWPNAHKLFNQDPDYGLSDLVRVLPLPNHVDKQIRSPMEFKSEEMENPSTCTGFGKLCAVRLFYFGLSEIKGEKVPLTWEEFISDSFGKEPEPYPMDKVPYLNFAYNPDTVLAAQNLVSEWTSNHDYYVKVESWFKRGKHHKLDMRSRGNLPNDFPYDLGNSYLPVRKNTPKRDWDYFTDLCRQLAFNYYAEEFLGLLLPFDHGVRTRPSGIEVVKDCPLEIDVDWAMAQDFTTQSTPEKLLEEIQECIDHSVKHFRKVENAMNTLEAYKDVPSANVQLIHGKPADKYTEAELMGLIRNARKAQEDIKDLVETSKRVKSKHEALEANIAIYVAALDALSE